MCYVKFHVENHRTTNLKMAQFHWLRISRDSSPTSSATGVITKVLLKRKVRKSKFDPLIDEVELIEAKPKYAHVRFPDGREDTVSTKFLAPKSKEMYSTNHFLNSRIPLQTLVTTFKIQQLLRPTRKASQRVVSYLKLTTQTLQNRFLILKHFLFIISLPHFFFSFCCGDRNPSRGSRASRCDSPPGIY